MTTEEFQEMITEWCQDTMTNLRMEVNPNYGYKIDFDNKVVRFYCGMGCLETDKTLLKVDFENLNKFIREIGKWNSAERFKEQCQAAGVIE